MAIKDSDTQVISVIQMGMTPNEADFGVPWIQNMQQRQSAWETRGGFGVIDQYDTKLNAGKVSSEGGAAPTQITDLGLEKHLGSYLIKNTSFGHRQVVSVWRAKCFVNNMVTDVQLSGDKLLVQKRKVYVVRIYDLDTDEHWEEILHNHTSQEENLLFRRHGNYETSIGYQSVYDRQIWTDAGVNEGEFANQFNTDKDEYFYFTEVLGQDASVRLIFGSGRAGAWVYSPCDFKAAEYQFREKWPQGQTDATCDWRDPYSESPVIQPIRVTNGDFWDAGQGREYVDQATFGKPQAACVLGSRVVWAVDNYLLFSDPEVPNAIIDANIQPFPDKIVAMAPTLGNLLVWTEEATYYYNPAQGTEAGLISGGSTTTVSTNVGCLGPNAWTLMDGAVLWIDKTGIWKNYGNVTATKLSEPLDLFFVNSGFSNPLTSYYTTNGNADPNSFEQPSTFYDWTTEAQAGINVSYNPSQKRVFFNIPYLNIAIVFENGGFHIWNFQSLVSTRYDVIFEEYVPVVQVQQNLPFSWILCDNNREIFMVSGIVEQVWDDDTKVAGATATLRSQILRSGMLLGYGRGGGIDRTLEYLREDRRRAVGEYSQEDGQEDLPDVELARDKGYVYFDKLRSIPVGRSFVWTESHVSPIVQITNRDSSPCWLPINFVPYSDYAHLDNGLNVTDIQIKFKFDNTHWKPLINLNNSLTNTNEVCYNIPPERLGSRVAYDIGAADTATQVGVYVTDNAGAADPNGNTIWINIRGTPYAGQWAGAPNFSFCPRFKNPLIELGFKRKDALPPPNGNVWDMGIRYMYGKFDLTAPPVGPATSYYAPSRLWHDHMPTDNPDYQPDGTNFQAVDWMYQGKSIIPSDDSVIKLRGVNAVLQSSSIGTPYVGKNWDAWPVRLFNILFSTNNKQFSAQFIDETQASPKAVLKFLKTTLRYRVQTTTTPQTLAQPVWNDPGILWASAAVAGLPPSDGDFQIGDGPQDNIRASADVKGEGVTFQMFGHIMNPAERLRIPVAKAFIRTIGSLRRKGRP